VFVQTLLAWCGITTAKLPRRITGKSLTLREYRLTDLAQLYGLLRADVLLQANGVVYTETPTFGSFCFWILTTFPLAYVIEVMADGGPRIVGFVGLYDLTLGRRLWVSVAIFQPEDRRQGYGKQALSLLLGGLARHRVVSKVYADVLRANTPSQRLFAQLGFVPERECADRIRLVKTVAQPLQRRLDQTTSKR
jgi:RimJ/RimL family protein N-acetyltransferase